MIKAASDKPKKNVGYGYVGTWDITNKLGWFLPRFLSGFGIRYPEPINTSHPVVDGQWFYKCKITIEPIKGKNGRYIRRRARYED